MKKRCFSCGVPFELSGSGRRQKCCPKCAVRVTGQGRVSQPSNTLKSKGAETPFEEAWVDRLSRLPDREGPIALLGPDGELWRLWPGPELPKRKFKKGEKENPEETRASEARHWRLTVSGVKEARPPRRKSKHNASPPKGFRIALTLEDEVPTIGSGYRLVVCQLRGKQVVLHHAGYTATIRREVFKELVASNKRYRKRNKPKGLRLVVSNPRLVSRFLDQESAA